MAFDCPVLRSSRIQAKESVVPLRRPRVSAGAPHKLNEVCFLIITLCAFGVKGGNLILSPQHFRMPPPNRFFEAYVAEKQLGLEAL
jgi:hypothetical protein